MQIILGDCFPHGIFTKVHSKFKHVVNFYWNGDFVVSVVKNSVGAGPFHLVVTEKYPLEAINKISFQKDLLTLNESIIEQKNILIFQAKPAEYTTDELKNLYFSATDTLKCFSNNKSMLFLLLPDHEFAINNSFDKHFYHTCLTAKQMLLEQHKLLEGIKLLKSLGYGLTPSGDDFIAGILLAINMLKIHVKNIDSNIKNRIFELAKGKNPISNSGLLAAKDGYCSQSLKEMLESLRTKELTMEKMQAFMAHGATSAADFLAGFLFTLKHYLCL